MITVTGGDSNIKRVGYTLYVLEVVKAALVPLRVFNLKSSTEGPFVLPVMVLSQKHMTEDDLLF